jgi:hypothetical protein
MCAAEPDWRIPNEWKSLIAQLTGDGTHFFSVSLNLLANWGD